MIPEQRYVFDSDEYDDNEDEENLKHMIELANMIAYENQEDEDGEHVAPVYIGRHTANLNTLKRRN